MTDLLDEDVLRRLARPDGVPATPPRALGDVRSRAATITRRRRATAVGAGSAAVAVLVAVALPLGRPAVVQPRPGVGPTTTSAVAPPVTPSGPACSGSDETLTLPAAADLLYVADSADTGPRRGPVFATRTTRCPPPSGAAVTTEAVTQYFGRTQVDLGGDVWVVVSRVSPAASRPAPAGARPVAVLPGVDGFWQSGDTRSDARGILTWERAGREFMIGGEVSLTKALRIARSLRQVGPDDPRLR